MLKRVSLGRLTTLLLVLSLGPFTVLASDTTPTDTPQLTIASSSEQRIENKPLIIANSKAWKPYSFLDKTGQPTGILVDLWKAYGAANNLDVEFSLVDWSDSIDITRQGKADIHAGLLWSPERAEFLTYGGELFEIDTQLYFHQTLQSFNANTFLLGNHNYKVGVVRGGYEAEYMRSQFPSVDLVYFDNNELMIKAARARNILAFVADLQVANYYLHTSSYSGQFIGVKHLYSGYLHYAIGGRNVIAIDAIASNFENVPQAEIDRILSRWMHIETVYPKHLPVISVIGVMLILVTYLLVFRYAISTRTKQLSKVNRELKYLSETDALTGLWNRRFFLGKLNSFKESNCNLTVMIIDIDDFKAINDTYGHLKGDVVIKAVAEKIVALTDSSHIVARIGGEEFALAFIGQPVDFSRSLAQKVCKSVNEIQLAEVDCKSITVSLGCVIYQKAHAFETLYEADKLMYAAKKQGKNQAVIEYLPTQVETAQAVE